MLGVLLMDISMEDINYLKNVVIDNDSFAIITHNNPDADAIGSSIFLEQLLINLNKTVDYIIQSKISPEFEPIVRKKRINKIFIPKYKKYDVVFILDACDCDRIYYRKNFANKTIIIDHHNNRPNIKYDKFINNNDISTGVTLYKIFNNFIEITPFMATCLYLTIIGDSDSFRIKNINSEVYDISSKLIQKGANTELINNSSPLLQVVLYATPLFIGPIIQVLLFGAYLGFIMAIVVSTLTTMMLSEGTPFFVLNLAASLIAIYVCNGATNRYRVIWAGTSYGSVVAIVVATFGLCVGAPLLIVCEQTIAAFFGGITTSIIALAILPIIEFVFKTNSNISLIDYTDLNNKKAHLLKTLQLIAPGTYHHSVMVSYLAEAAAQAVKANSMVCRVGALYHDIGKLSKPEFFSENQKDVNPHDDQNPSMSALIIKNHVSDGVAKAEVEKMPRQIIHAIKQHHGTSIIAYFFNKAKKKAEASGRNIADFRQIMREEGIEESTYRHDGQKPQTVENAIIMIADSCEAASRSMKKPTKHGIETMVDAIVNSKMTDGQLDECPITVKQISLIKRTVSDTLLNMLHSRVDYKQVQ